MVRQAYQDPHKYGRSVDLTDDSSATDPDHWLGLITMPEASLNRLMGRDLSAEVAVGEKFVMTIGREAANAQPDG